MTFETNELAWRCKESKRCECTEWEDLSQDNGTAQKLYDIWFDIIEKFSSCNFTYPGDRLPALAGVAARFARYLNDQLGEIPTYVCGMWKEDLFPSLCWKSPFAVVPIDQSTTSYIAPSWSWASVNGAVEFQRHSSRQNTIQFAGVDVEGVDYGTRGSDPFGKVESASLTLSAHVMAVVMKVPWETNSAIIISLHTPESRGPFLQINSESSRHPGTAGTGRGCMYPNIHIGDTDGHEFRFVPFNKIPDTSVLITCCQCGSGPKSTMSKGCLSCGHEMCDSCSTENMLSDGTVGLHGLLILSLDDGKTYYRVGYLAQQEGTGTITCLVEKLGGRQRITII